MQVICHSETAAKTEPLLTDKTYDSATFVILASDGNKESNLYVENSDYETY